VIRIVQTVNYGAQNRFVNFILRCRKSLCWRAACNCVSSPACGTLGVCFAASRDHAVAAGFAFHTFSAMKFRVDFRQHVVSCGSVCSEPRESRPICLAEFSTPALLLNLQVLILKFCGCTF